MIFYLLYIIIINKSSFKTETCTFNNFRIYIFILRKHEDLQVMIFYQ